MSAKVRSLRANEYLFREGDSSHAMFIVKKGSLSIRKRSTSGQIELARVFTGEVVGEMAFFDRLPRSASACALTEVEVIEIDFLSMDKIYTTIPPYMKTIMMAVVERLRRADETIRRLMKDIEPDKLQELEEQMDAASVLAATSESKTPAEPVSETAAADEDLEKMAAEIEAEEKSEGSGSDKA